MVDATKLRLSEKEMELVMNSEWILTKHTIINRVCELFGELLNEMKSAINKDGKNNSDFVLHNGKISKGEQYRQLPYVILDYPRLFGKIDTYAIRTMFWWGNYFSITLQISGEYRKLITCDTEALFKYLRERNFYICIHTDEWQHHFGSENYIKIENLELSDFKNILEKDFFKISKNIPLSAWDTGYDFLIEGFRELINPKFFSYPTGEKDL